MSPGFRDAFSVGVKLDRGCRELNSAVVNGKGIALISESSNDTAGVIYTDVVIYIDVVIYTEGSVMHHHQSCLAFIALAGGRIVQEASGEFLVTTSAA